MTINSQRGLFTCQDGVLLFAANGRTGAGIPKVAVYLDHILTGMDTADHLKNLGSVLQKLEGAGLRLKREKCVFLQDDVESLGHKVKAQGLPPVERSEGDCRGSISI